MFGSRGSCAYGFRPWWVPLHQLPAVAPPAGGRPAIQFRQVFVRWDVEGVGSRLWGGPFPAPSDGRRHGVHRWCYERVCPAQVRDPYASLVWLVGVEPQDPRVDSVVRDLVPGGGLCGALPVALARPAFEWWGCAPARCKASSIGVRDRWQTMSVGRWASVGPPWPLSIPSWKTTRRVAGGGVRLQRRDGPGILVSWCCCGVPPCTPGV